MVLVELFCGTASLTLWVFGRVGPLTGYMGSKRRDRETLATILRIDRRPAEVHIVDAGPWGEVWKGLKSPSVRRAVIDQLYDLDRRGSLIDLWSTFVHRPSPDLAERIVQYLVLQSRSAGCIPIWWCEERCRWESPSGSRTYEAHARGGIDARRRRKGQRRPVSRGRLTGPLYGQGQARGMQRVATLAHRIEALVATLAHRIEALEQIEWSALHVHHADVADFRPIQNSVVYLDPPYRNRPRYAVLCRRDKVVDLMERHAHVAQRVVVSEGEPIGLPGWEHRRLRKGSDDEWLTIFERGGYAR